MAKVLNHPESSLDNRLRAVFCCSYGAWVDLVPDDVLKMEYVPVDGDSNQ